MKNKGLMIFLTIGLFLPIVIFAIYVYYDTNVAPLPYFGKSSNGDKQKYKVPPFSFTNQQGRQFHSDESILGKITVVHSFFTSCGSICPKMIAGDKKILESFPNDGGLLVLSFTVDPARDTPEKLTSYINNSQLPTDRWVFLTGNKKELYHFARNSIFIAAADAGNGAEEDFIHSEKAVLLDREAHIRGFYDLSDKGGVDELIKNIKILKKQS